MDDVWLLVRICSLRGRKREVGREGRREEELVHGVHEMSNTTNMMNTKCLIDVDHVSLLKEQEHPSVS